MPIIYLAMRNLHSGLGLEDERSDMTELEALRELVAFREYGTLSAAADELRITQPTMTRTMRKLERELGVPLFDRRAKNRLSLTHTGELAAQEAEQLLDAYDRFVETVRNDANLHNEIVVGSVAPGPLHFLEQAGERNAKWESSITVRHSLIEPDAVLDDLLLRTNELLARFPDVLAKYQDRFRYILVDEYQDTNHSQYLIVKALADLYRNICVVGDDAQSIYSFRGANIANILHFNRDYPEARIFKLEQNYRSTKNIVGAANSVIAKNRDKLDKDVWTANDAGEPVRVVRNLTDGDEAKYIARTIKSLREDDPKARYQDFAVLYRTNSQSRAIEDALLQYNIPYRIWGGLSFYARKEIKDALAYMRLAVNPKDEEALLRVINYPARGIGDTTLNKLIVAANKKGWSIFEVIGDPDSLSLLDVHSGVRAKLDVFATMIQAFGVYASTLDAFEAADKILRESGILSLMSSATDPEDVARYENVQELVNGIKDFVESQKEIADEDASLSTFVQQVPLLTDMDRGEESDTDRVALMTVHMAKGLEFGTVFVAGMEENLFPSMMSSSTREEIEEERRLFYVALTRAERRAILTYAEQRYRWGKLTDGELSRFVDEIDDRYLEFSVPKEMRRAAASSILDAGIFGAASGPSAPAPFRRRAERPSGSASGRAAAPKNLKPLGKAVAAAAGAGASGGGDLAVGDRVRHERFGDGTVLTLEGAGADAKATIRFDNIGEKKMLLKFAKIQKI